MTPTVFLLIALLKTPGEGGTVMIEFPTEAACTDAGQRLEAQFEGIVLDPKLDGTPTTGAPKDYWTCLEAPSQR